MPPTQPQKNIFLKSPYFNNFNVESVATVKGLKLVSKGQFPGVTMKKITSANENEIDSLDISSSTKTIFHTAIANGHIIYTPTKAVTYGNWQGLFYITTNFNDEASYIIGEGLNGGYSVCGLPGMGGICNWTQGVIDLLLPQAQASGITATISVNPISVFVGETVNVVIRFTKGTFSWVQNLFFKPTRPGTITINAGNDTDKVVVVKKEIQYGTTHPEFDKEIKKYATTDIPGPLIKSMIQKESKFDPDAIRYEIHTDYNWYSKLISSTLQRVGWRGLVGYPEKHWRLEGHNVPNENFADGNQVKDMKVNIYQRMGSDATPKLIVSKGDTAQMIVTNNPRRGWTRLPSNLNYTAQLILASSYGLMQPLYDTARWNTFEDLNSPARSVEDLFVPDTNIKVGTHTLNFYLTVICGGDIICGLQNYNGGGDANYASDVLKYVKDFKEIT